MASVDPHLIPGMTLPHAIHPTAIFLALAANLVLPYYHGYSTAVKACNILAISLKCWPSSCITFLDIVPITHNMFILKLLLSVI